MEGVDRLDERRHRRRDVDADLVEASPEPAEVHELRARHLRERRLVVDGRREPGVLREPLERAELAVGEDAEEVDDRLPTVVGRHDFRPVGHRAER